MPSILKPNESVTVAIATGILVYAVNDRFVPNGGVMSKTPAFDDSIETGRRQAAWTEAGIVAGLTLLTRDVNILIVGAAMIFALDWKARHANATDPDTGNLVSPAPGYGTGRNNAGG